MGEIGDKNDISFVVGAWMALLKSNWFNGATTVKIWSDGTKALQNISKYEVFWLFNRIPHMSNEFTNFLHLIMVAVFVMEWQLKQKVFSIEQ